MHKAIFQSGVWWPSSKITGNSP